MASLRKHHLLILAILPVAYFPFSEWIATTPIGTTFFLWGQLFWMLLFLLAFASVPVIIVCLCIRRTRQRAIHYILPVLLLLPSCIVGVWIGEYVRITRMHAFAQRSTSLVTAIEKYTKDYKTPPDSLDELVPDYLSAVPSTGMMAYPKYEYHVGPEAVQQYDGNPWALTVFTPSGGINFDMMLYLPKGNYPEAGYGGGLQRLGDWAYVHE